MAELHVDEFGRTHPPQNSDEVASLRGFLNYQRDTLRWKCRSVSDTGMQATTAASTMTLGGLLKHMAYVEDAWFSVMLFGNEKAEPWRSADWDTDNDWDWNTANEDTPEELVALWSSAVHRSELMLEDALAGGGLDRVAARSWPGEPPPSLRWIMLHMIEEYARHNGHADLLRESYDGETGE